MEEVKETINLKEEVEKYDEEGDYETLEALVKMAILDSREIVRMVAVTIIKRGYDGIIKRGYVGDNSIFITVNGEDNKPVTCYICEVPEEYLGEKVNPRAFEI